MARAFFPALLALCLCCTSVATGRAQASQARPAPAINSQDWKEYTYAGDGFAISAPAEPSVTRDTRNSAGGVKERHRYQIYLNGGDTSLVVTVTALAARDPRPVAQVFDDTKNTAAQQLGANATGSTALTLRNYPGVQFELTTERIHARLRYYLVNRLLYQLGSVAPIDQPFAKETDHWFDSFRPLNEQK